MKDGVPDQKTEGGISDSGEAPEAMLAAIGSFKDWSNYLLVTTVIALGWVATSGSPAPSGGDSVSTSNGCFGSLEVEFLAGSAIFGILTLSLVPIVTQNIAKDTKSIYDVDTPFRLFYIFGDPKTEFVFWGHRYPFKLKLFCWPQHALLILAIALHAIRYLMGDLSQVLQPNITPAVFESVHHAASVGFGAQLDEKGERLIWIDARALASSPPCAAPPRAKAT
jgi:hypothetical protein